jgi:alpha-N-acetylglucosamine transferase
MSGMQDVTSLAYQYQTLSDHSKLLQNTVQKLKKEVSESYDTVKLKTQELERIHEANFLLNQLKQFVRAKNQLEQYLKNHDDKGK